MDMVWLVVLVRRLPRWQEGPEVTEPITVLQQREANGWWRVRTPYAMAPPSAYWIETSEDGSVWIRN